MAEPIFPPVPQPPMAHGHMVEHAGTVKAVIDNGTALPYSMVG